MNNTFKKISITEIKCYVLFWIACVFLCIYFYIERSTYADNSYYVFSIIQHKNFCFQHARYAAVLTQWLPVLLATFGAPLKYILVAFSVCPVFYYVIIFIAVIKFSSEKWMIYLFLLSMISTIHYSFFYVNSELMEGSPLLILFAVLIKSEKQKPVYKILSLLCIVLVLMFLHLFLVLSVLMILALFFIQKPSKEILAIAVMIITLLLIKKFIFTDVYEDNAMNVFDWRAITLRNIHASFFPKFLFHGIIFHFQFAILFAIYLIIKSKPSWKYMLAVSLAIVVLYFIIMLFLRYGAIDAYADTYTAILYYFIWSAIILIVKDIDLSIRQEKLIIVLMLFSFVRIFFENEFSDRIHFLKSLMTNNESKQIYLFEDMPKNIQSITWSIPYETLIISSLEMQSKTILVKEASYKIDSYLKDSTVFLGSEWTFRNNEKLDKNYFNLENSLYKYHQ